jgi:alkanesulfonate monooxygenase SsuD/methylene tetrahydromethanopterin reductase-like flavin-dependent oxidoreductase (luciferase family)
MLSNRHPVALAEETALLDHLSGGRFGLGVGRGGPWVDLEVFGTGLARYDQGFGESLDLLLTSLERGRVAAGGEGGFFRFREVPVVPRPSTSPRPPVAVAATSTGTVEQAAARGLPLILGMHATDEEKAAFVEHYASVAARHGHDPGRADHMAVAVCHVADSRARAVRELRATMPAWLDRGLGQYVSLRPSPQPRRDAGTYVEHLLAMHPVGTPEYCAERLAASVDRTGIRHILLMVEGTGELRRTLETIERVGSEVVPRLGSSAVPTGQPH